MRAVQMRTHTSCCFHLLQRQQSQRGRCTRGRFTVLAPLLLPGGPMMCCHVVVPCSPSASSKPSMCCPKALPGSCMCRRCHRPSTKVFSFEQDRCLLPTTVAPMLKTHTQESCTERLTSWQTRVGLATNASVRNRWALK